MDSKSSCVCMCTVFVFLFCNSIQFLPATARHTTACAQARVECALACGLSVALESVNKVPGWLAAGPALSVGNCAGSAVNHPGVPGATAPASTPATDQAAMLQVAAAATTWSL